jgi:hypothetical protein
MTELNPQRKPRNDGRVAFIVVLACLLLIGGLRVAASGAASSKDKGTDAIPIPSLSSEQECNTWAGFWTNLSGVGASQKAIEGMSNCRLDASGTWFVPTSSADSRLPNGPILTADEQAKTAALRNDITAQTDNLQKQFPQSLQKKVATIYSDDDNAVIGHLKDTEPISDVRSRYSRLTQAFLMDPANAELADYVGWLMANRQSAFGSFNHSCHQDDIQYLWVACDGIAGALSVNYPPWPWDLMDSLNLDAYLKWALDNGKIPTSTAPVAGTATT